jgi:ribosome-binding factor A
MTRHRSAEGPSQRQLRAGELIRHALAEIFQREDLREPALRGLSITVSEVRASPDLKQATAFVMPLGGGAEGADVAAVVGALNRAAPAIRGYLGKKIDLKFTPAVKFVADQSFDEAQKIEKLLHRPEVARDLDPQ